MSGCDCVERGGWSGRRRRLVRSWLAAMLAVVLVSGVASVASATDDVDFGTVSLGASASRDVVLPLGYALSELDPTTVLYSGGSSGVDLALSLVGLGAPLTAGDLYAAIGEVSATFHLSLATTAGSDFSVDGSGCTSGTGTCTAVVEFTPTAEGPHSDTVRATLTDLAVSGGGSFASLIALMAPFLASAVEDELDFGVSGVGTDTGRGQLVITVDVPTAPAPCLLLDAETIEFGSLGFSTPDSLSSASREVTATSCSNGEQLVYSRGTDATGNSLPPTTWSLSVAGGNPCAVGVNKYGLSLSTPAGSDTPAVVQLSTANAEWLGLAAEEQVATAVGYQMPCVGSAGAGQTMSSEITFLAVTP